MSTTEQLVNINQQAQETNDEMEGKYLTFWTDSQLFGIPIAEVVQIVGMQGVTPIPEYPFYAKGVINLRGAIIPVIDVRLRLGKQEAEYNDRTCIIVTSLGEGSFGFIVDEVDEVTQIHDDQFSEPPKMADGAADQFLTGIARLSSGSDHGEKLVLLVDVHKILGQDASLIMAETPV